MKNAKTPEELIARFVSKEDSAEATQQVSDFITEIRGVIEREGRIAELKRMIDYHQYMADLKGTAEADKHVHMADIIVLQQRVQYLQGRINDLEA